jgi:hypothetical protein
MTTTDTIKSDFPPLDKSYLRTLPMPRLVELVRGAAVTPRAVSWHDVCLVLLERIEDAKGFPDVLYDEWYD